MIRTTITATILALAACSTDDGPTTAEPYETSSTDAMESSSSADAESSSSDGESSTDDDGTDDDGASSDDTTGDEGSSSSTGDEPSPMCTETFDPWEPCTPGCACTDGTTCLIGHDAELGHLAYCAPVCETSDDCAPDPDGRPTSCVASAFLNRCAVECTEATEVTDCPEGWSCYSTDLAAPPRCMPPAA